MTREDMTTLENLLDRCGMRDLRDALQEICHEKADHIRSNWQDSTSGRAWDRQAVVVGKLRIEA